MWQYLLGSILLLVALHLVKRVEQWRNRRRYAQKYSTKDPVRISDIRRPEGGSYTKETVQAFRKHQGLELLRKRHEACGYTFESHTLGGRIVNTSEPENIKAVLATHFQDYSLGFRQAALGPLLGKGVFTTDGQEWKHSRGLVRPNVEKAHVTDLSILEKHIRQLLAHIPRDGRTIDVQDYFFKLSFDNSTEFLFGESVRSFEAAENSEEARFAAAFDFASGETIRRLQYGPFLPLYFNRDFTKACKVVHRFVDNVVAKALARRASRKAGEKTGNYNFLDGLMDSVTEPKRLRSETLNLMQAGRDTTAGMLGHVFYLLARRSDVWAKLEAEVATLEGRAPTYEDLQQLTYLRQVMNETLRIYPVAPINSRVAVRDTILPTGGGPDHKSPIFIPAGQKISFPVYVMHRRKDIYGPDANEFRPERWGEPNFRPGWAYLPFNGGPRVCLGQQFAMTEVGYTIVRLVQTFKAVIQRDFSPYKEHVRISASVYGGVQVGLIPRD
ncbi:cytochrome P450 [Aspergillus clavatus NRRL 1]|uniref:N-alkane-inducible cytochrome P450 n=1 Tax=Aspergillus clavatus (strain ATCC 1007 / CBS 513.65 / DSM 816 / NCTC 3887 / NRRL 1 / QM 1276 / 107) TaxID=344612 RepID=A1C9K9_ASPCL|nr:n-alkane-inducible cytochrome P450 [Aspergillus clavatus NRRL 1]EAW13533.1 n-alkane-inducible cytochrome P450 [Aspergillus clavatus NRRL 1]